MNNKVLVVGAGEYQVSGIKKLKEQNYYVIALDGNAKAVGQNYADEFHHIDIKESSEVIALVNEHEWELLSCMSFCSDIPLRTVGKVNDLFKLKGITESQALVSTNKFRQREVLKEINLPYPNWRIVDSENYSLKNNSNFSDIAYPCIVKPIDGSGSRGVSLVYNEQELHILLKEAFKNTNYESLVIIEEFIEGIEFTIESMIHNGEVQMLAISEKGKPIGNFTVSTELFYNSPLTKKMEKDILGVVNPFLMACGFNNTICHTEVIYSFDDQKIYIVETATRSGGFGIFDKILPKITGLDIVACTIDAMLGKVVDFQNMKKRNCLLRFFTGNQGTIKRIVVEDSYLEHLKEIEYGFFLKEGDEAKSLTTDGARLGYLLSYGDTWQETLSKAGLIDYAIRFEIQMS